MLLSLKMKEHSPISPEFQWLEGRRYHNTPGASYLLPNDIDEVDRLQLQHFILRYAIQGNYKSPIEKSKVRAILDVGCGPGTWTMEMANEFPDALVTGIDMSPVFPTTIIPPNCRFVQHNILDPLPFPDNSFDFVYQRLLVAGLTPDDWTRVAKELERVTVPGGWIELVEVDGHGGNNGPNTAKIWGWVERALMSRGVNSLIGREPGLCKILEMGGATNVQQDVLRLPTGEHGGKIGQLLKENEQSFWNAMTPMIMHEVGVDKNEIEEAIEMADDEVEEYQSFHIFYVVTGQKRILVVDHDDDDNNHRLRPLTITTNTTATKTTTSTTTTNNNNNNTNTNNNTNSRSNHVNKPYRRLSPEQAAGASRGARGRGEP